jgi:hypothetical protein
VRTEIIEALAELPDIDAVCVEPVAASSDGPKRVVSAEGCGQ